MARIYEVNPLLCPCGKEMRIVEFVTYPPYDDFADWNISQLVSDTPDGFPSLDEPIYHESGPDPPHVDYYDPPHSEETSYIVYD